ncbi:MAG: hypothetical protein LQ338_004856 [Usnochroma carphineum]|nr:MAG: hypothetical protein LQ338_004856 [Usnochroma carphineum]
MDPSGPSQPTLNAAYDQPSNPASQSDYEQRESTSTSASIQRSAPTVERRERGDVPVPSSHEGGPTPSSLGYGARDSSGDAGESMGGPVSSLEGEQLRPPGEGDVASAQDSKGGFGEQADLASDLDRKKEEQRERLNDRYGGGSSGKGGPGGVDVQSAIGGGGKGVVGASQGSGARGFGEGEEGGGRGLEGLRDV